MAHPQQTFVTIPAPVVSAAPPPATSGGYKQGGGISTGIIQIICGLASILFGIVSWLVLTGVIYDENLHLGHIFGVISWPIWGGVLYLVTGSLGAASRKGKKCLIVAYMVMSIIAAVCATGQLIWESIAAGVSKCYDYYGYGYNGCSQPEIGYGMHVGAVLVALLEIIVAITGSAFGCHGVCCTSQPKSNQTQQIVVQYHPQPAQTTVNFVPQPQGAPGPNAPPAYSTIPQDNTYMEIQ